MLKPLFDVFQVTEQQLTAKAIKWLRISSVLSLFALPSYMIVEGFDLGPVLTGAFSLLAMAGLLGILYAYSSRVLNRVWTPDKYLDEAEKERKRSASTFAFIVVVASAMIVCAGALLFWFVSGEIPAFLAHERAAIYTLGLIIMFAISLQAIHLAWNIKPIEDAAAEDTQPDKRYKSWIAFYIGLCVIVPVGVRALDRVIDQRTIDSAAAHCEGMGVKSVDTRGLFKSRIECSNSDQ